MGQPLVEQERQTVQHGRISRSGCTQHDGSLVTAPAVPHEQRLAVEVMPLYAATTEPSELITSESFERISEEMLHVLEQQGPWDGVLLALHGAAVSAAYPDADGELIAWVRRLVGPVPPIALTLHQNANLSPQMVEQVTVTVPHRTNPHLDARYLALPDADRSKL